MSSMHYVQACLLVALAQHRAHRLQESRDALGPQQPLVYGVHNEGQLSRFQDADALCSRLDGIWHPEGAVLQQLNGGPQPRDSRRQLYLKNQQKQQV